MERAAAIDMTSSIFSRSPGPARVWVAARGIVDDLRWVDADQPVRRSARRFGIPTAKKNQRTKRAGEHCAYAAMSATETSTKTTITRRDPGPHDVAIDIKFAGIRHSDIHTVKAEWGPTELPQVLVRSPWRGDRRGSEAPAPAEQRVGVGCFDFRAASATVARAASHTAGRTTTTDRQRRPANPRAATAKRSSSTKTTCCADTRRAAPDAVAASAGITLPPATAPLECRANTWVAIIGLGDQYIRQLGAAMGADVTVLSQR